MSETLSPALQAAVNFHSSGKHVEAERGYLEILSRDGANAAVTSEPWILTQATHNLGRLLLDTGRAAEAIPYLRQAHEGVPTDRSIRLAYCIALFATGRVTDAAAIAPSGWSAADGLPAGVQLDVIAQRRKEIVSTSADHLVELLNIYSASSAGNNVALSELALVGANRLPMLLAQLATGDRFANGKGVLPIDSICRDAASRTAADRLAAAFNVHGSDKARPGAHNYHELYGFILRVPDAISAVFEIGLGTNNPDVVSNMMNTGTTGASLRAFRDYLPRARIYGADVDKRVLFSEERIETFFVDQTDQLTFDTLGRSLPDGFDLIIDDGLHAPDANLTALLFALPRIKPGGWFVVEDIKHASLPVWRIVPALLPHGYAARIVQARRAYMFVVERLKEGQAASLPEA